MKEILEKIKAVLANWHGHVDPQAAIQKLMHDFMEEVHREIEALKQGVDADAASFVHGEIEKFGKGMQEFIKDIESAVSGFEKELQGIKERLVALEPKSPPADDTVPPTPKAE